MLNRETAVIPVGSHKLQGLKVVNAGKFRVLDGELFFFKDPFGFLQAQQFSPCKVRPE